MILVQHIIEDARRRLAVIDHQASVCSAAKILAASGTPLAVVCDAKGTVIGVISRTDVVKVIAATTADAMKTSAGALMTSPVFSCRRYHTLARVWATMRERSLRCVPVLDDSGRPEGIVHARDLVRALLLEVEEEEVLLRDYVLGVGYR